MGLVCLDAPLIEKTWRYFSKSNYILDWARWPVNLKCTFINYAWRFEVRNLSLLFFFIDICKLLYISTIKTQMFTPLIQAYWFWKVQKFFLWRNNYVWIVLYALCLVAIFEKSKYNINANIAHTRENILEDILVLLRIEWKYKCLLYIVHLCFKKYFTFLWTHHVGGERICPLQ